MQAETLEPGTYYLNPYVQEVRLVDCRSQRYNLNDIGFPTKDGFWVSLEAIIEFRVKPEQAAKTYILFNEEREGKTLAEEIIAKVILPNARAYTRLQGSNYSGKEFIAGDTRVDVPGKFSGNDESELRQTGHRSHPGADYDDQAARQNRRSRPPAGNRPATGRSIQEGNRATEGRTEIGRAKGHGFAEEGTRLPPNRKWWS